MVLDAEGDLLAWNEPTLALIGDITALPPAERNLTRRRFLGDEAALVVYDTDEERRASRKAFDHPVIGRLTLDCDVLLLPDADQRLIVYSAEPGTPDADALDLLRVVGVQELA